MDIAANFLGMQSSLRYTTDLWQLQEELESKYVDPCPETAVMVLKLKGDAPKKSAELY